MHVTLSRHINHIQSKVQAPVSFFCRESPGLLTLLQLGVHTDNAANQVPVSVGTNPVGHHHTRAGSTDGQLPGTLALLAVPDAEVLDNRRVHLGGDALGPAARVEEVAGAQEVDEDGREARALVAQRVVLLGGALELAPGEFNLLLDVLRLRHLVEVLHADEAVADVAVLAVVGPPRGVDAEAPAVPLVLELLVEVEAADEDDAAAHLAEAGDAGLGGPALGLLVDVVALEVLAHLLVVGLAVALALDAHDDGLGAVLLEEFVDVVEHVAKVLGARQGDGEGAVDETEGGILGVCGDADIEEAHTVVELLPDAHGLAADRGQGLVAGWGVVRAWDGETAEGPVVVELVHPGIEAGGGVDGYEGTVGNIDGGELLVRLGVDPLHCAGALVGAGDVDLMALVLPPEDEAEDLAITVRGADVSLLSAEWVGMEADIVLFPGIARDKPAGLVLGGVEEAGDVADSVADDVTCALLPGLEPLYADELNWVDGEIANGEVGHGCGLEEGRRQG